MGPLIVAGIMAGTGLLQGLLSQKAAAEKQKRDMEAEGIKQSFGTQIQAQNNLAQGEQNAMNTLVEGYRAALQPRQVKF